jgi:hypothetical protein
MVMINEHRRAAIRRYADKALSPGALQKIIHDPWAIGRAIRTLASNRNLRTVPDGELLRNAEASISALAHLAPKAKRLSFDDWLPIRTNGEIEELGQLFKSHGSDKSTDHDYFEVYGSILCRKRNEFLRILEIGLGTNNLAYQSNMGLGGRPGASLRAFRDWAPKADVFGADIDRGVLFAEDRIQTYFVDQSEPATLRELAQCVGTGFDLIIDDGLHLPHAGLNTIEALLPLLKLDGTMVIEDIDPLHLDYWKTAAAVLTHHETYLAERRGGHLFVIRKKK